MIKIGVLALQGAFAEHIRILRSLGAEAVAVRLPQDLKRLHGLIIPGGESTTIGKLAVQYDLITSIRRFARAKAVWGTCAGMILMAKHVGNDQPLLGIMDISVQRNAFGRQIDSFETELYVSVFQDGNSKLFPAVFIRAPRLVATWGKAEVIARLVDGTPVAARQGKMMATAFHPELSEDHRFHQFFLDLARM